MKTLTPKVKFIFIALLVLLFGITNLSAQSFISKSDNGKVICEYKKKDQNAYQVVLVYKNDQYIYTPEIDSVVLQSNESLQGFIKDFRNGIASLDQNKWEAQQLLDWLVGIQWGKE
jgi:NADH/NAD ratio-sensing transcriptional regulator Rex